MFIAYLATMMIPGAVTLIPTFILMRVLGWINTYWALIVPGMFTAIRSQMPSSIADIGARKTDTPALPSTSTETRSPVVRSP